MTEIAEITDYAIGIINRTLGALLPLFSLVVSILMFYRIVSIINRAANFSDPIGPKNSINWGAKFRYLLLWPSIVFERLHYRYYVRRKGPKPDEWEL